MDKKIYNPAGNEFTIVMTENLRNDDISHIDSFSKGVFSICQASILTGQKIKFLLINSQLGFILSEYKMAMKPTLRKW